VIGARFVREAEHFFLPIRRGAIIDRFIGAQRPGAGQFLVAAGRDDHPRSVQFGKLEGKDGNPAGAQHHHGLPGL